MMPQGCIWINFAQAFPRCFELGGALLEAGVSDLSLHSQVCEAGLTFAAVIGLRGVGVRQDVMV